jgi:hypothetical protein
VRRGDWKLIADVNHTMVYNVRQDAGERDDLTNSRQDIARELRPLLTAWEMEVNAEQRVNEPEQAERLLGPARQGGPGDGREALGATSSGTTAARTAPCSPPCDGPSLLPLQSS